MAINDKKSKNLSINFSKLAAKKNGNIIKIGQYLAPLKDA